MITIIAGSNRKGNISNLIAELYKRALLDLGIDYVKLINLENMPLDILHPGMYSEDNEWIENAKKEYLFSTDKFIFILPEYNGTFPGAVKLFIDALSSKDAEKTFYGKKAALVGISAGKFGNWLGLEHFGVVMNYLKINVFHQKVSIANIWKYMKDEVSFEDEKTEEYIKRQLEGFIKF